MFVVILVSVRVGNPPVSGWSDVVAVGQGRFRCGLRHSPALSRLQKGQTLVPKTQMLTSRGITQLWISCPADANPMIGKKQTFARLDLRHVATDAGRINRLNRAGARLYFLYPIVRAD
jgi:hypothetical protein